MFSQTFRSKPINEVSKVSKVMLETDRIIKKGLLLLPDNYFTRSEASNASLKKANIKFKRSASQSN